MKTMISMLLALALLCMSAGLAETGAEQEEEAMKMWIGETAVQVPAGYQFYLVKSRRK